MFIDASCFIANVFKTTRLKSFTFNGALKIINRLEKYGIYTHWTRNNVCHIIEYSSFFIKRGVQ